MILYGARGQAKVMYDLILSNNQLLEYLVDDNPPADFPHHLPIYLPSRELLLDKKVIIAIGDNRIREMIYDKTKEWCSFEIMQHYSAYVSRFTEFGDGSVIMPKVCINAEVSIGMHCIINTASVIEHECVIGDFVHISPSASLAGNITVKKGAHIGLGANVIQGITIGENAVIGAGAVVLSDVPDHAVVVGNPGRIIRFGTL
ncbi:acetyltransferase [Kaistella palustris]|uniref:acetyltransferase n=1 Tax=Kaistella palustris TaxID=493376 RepID=UPI000401CB2E|nr:acetyltransferase [Kaistella palustris]